VSAPAPEADVHRAVIPRATYRLQLHRDFGFAHAQAVLPYLARLGISHVYCSPITCARPGSLHGYDVTDHARINPELGGEDGFFAFASAAKSLGLGLLLDQVPNHMGVFGADNAWWMDVLENGPASAHASHFDIDWNPPNPGLAGKLLVPVLGGTYGEVLEAGEITLRVEPERGMLVLGYHQHRFPLDPRSYPAVLRAAAAHPEVVNGPSARLLEGLAEACAALPPRDAEQAESITARRLVQRELQRRLAELLAGEPGVAAALAATAEGWNHAPGHDALHALHEAQAYRLAYWRMAADEINYRRFFDVNDLGALRIEDEAVFEAVQGRALDLAAAGWVDGFRIDHPDGLRDPAAYFARLQQGYAARRGIAPPTDGSTPFRPLYVVAEKIAAAYEEVPRDWALHGTTGYRFANVVNGLFVERRHAQRMDRLWHTFSGSSAGFEALAQQCKGLVARGALSSQLTVLTHALQRIALRDRRTRDHGFHTLREALAEVAAAMPVYRTYVTDSASAQDRRFIDWAVAQARRRSQGIDGSLFDFVRRCLLVDPEVPADPGQVQDFAAAFQQFCAPVAAKGVEDTAFYRYHRLVSLNEVGGDPGNFGTSAAAFHGASADRAARWPHTMLATSTHDNKRSEDVRCRIDVLSERPAAWRLALARWTTGTRAWRSTLDGEEAPSRADQYLLHQTLLGTLPAEGLTADELPAYRERIEQYMLKAAREAKERTQWARPNEAYEAALLGFVRGLLGRVDGNPVLSDLQARASELSWYGALNGLSMTLLKFCSPGVPDVYQGTELHDLSLVDPDNRRPVDYALRARALDELRALHDALEAPADAADRAADPLALLKASPTDGRLKLWTMWRVLRLRREQPDLFETGAYLPVRVRGTRRYHVIAFARRSRRSVLLVVAARKFTGLIGEPWQWPVGALWADTALHLPPGLGLDPRARDLLSGRHPFAEAADALPAAPVGLAGLLGTLPVCAVLFERRPSDPAPSP
jgi:(1->4)-alpha-D-glucan 1-alpha-D-glucosylmutase